MKLTTLPYCYIECGVNIKDLTERRLLHIQLMILIKTENICKLKNHLEILLSTSHHQHWHWYCKNFLFVLYKLFEKVEFIVKFTSIFFHVLNYSSSVWYHFTAITHFSKVSYYIDVIEKSAKDFQKLSSKTLMVESFWSTLEGCPVRFLESCLQQLYCAESFSEVLNSKGYLRSLL